VSAPSVIEGGLVKVIGPKTIGAAPLSVMVSVWLPLEPTLTSPNERGDWLKVMAASELAGMGISHMPRPCVAAKSVVCATSVKTFMIGTLAGSSVCRLNQLLPLSSETKTPTSPPTTRTGPPVPA
jgi:hypothetical protein